MTVLQLNMQLYRVMGEIGDDKDIVSQILDFAKDLADKKRARLKEKEKQKTLAEINESFAELKQIKLGKAKGIPLEEVLNEL
ncbi:MAG: hypothetical protein II075_05915 [Bacteroidales bacterium]|nr:hypothetical protein [Bacteroidales bacterium]MBQ1697400.1 hypothetical protein [Bacteroidales bacterium]